MYAMEVVRYFIFLKTSFIDFVYVYIYKGQLRRHRFCKLNLLLSLQCFVACQSYHPKIRECCHNTAVQKKHLKNEGTAKN